MSEKGLSAKMEHPAQPKRRLGCILLASLLFAIWAVGAWVLWHLALNAPPTPEDEQSAPFEIMPKAEGS